MTALNIFLLLRRQFLREQIAAGRGAAGAAHRHYPKESGAKKSPSTSQRRGMNAGLAGGS